MLKDDVKESAQIVPLFPNENRSQPSPAESLRLIRAFVAIADPGQRLGVIEWVEKLAMTHGQDNP